MKGFSGFTCVVGALFVAQALASPREDFNRAYARYQDYSEKEEWRQALDAAKESYDLGKEVFGEDSINLANLAVNYGLLLGQFSRRDEAEAALLVALQIFEARHGRKAPELVDLLVELGRTTFDRAKPNVGMKHFNRAARLATAEGTVQGASAHLRIGIFLAANGGASENFFKRAHVGFRREFGEGDARTALAAFNLAKNVIRRNDLKQARPLLTSAVQVFEKAGNEEYELQARAFLVHVFEELGDRDAATPHCRAIGRKTRLAPDEPYIPIYRRPPVVPREARRKGVSGWVVVEFSVDESGFTQDREVVESSSELFHDAALEAAGNFRFAPRHEDGVPVATAGVRNRITFTSSK